MASRMLQRLFLLALPIVLAACGSVKYADEEAVRAARTFEAAGDMSRIYVFRDDNVVLNTPITISVDGRTLGVTENKSFVMATVAPGQHTVVAKAENTDELAVETSGGEVVFVEIGVNLGVVTNRAHLKQVGGQRGKQAVMRSRMVE